MKKGVLDPFFMALPDTCIAWGSLSLCSAAPAQHPGQRPTRAPCV